MPGAAIAVPAMLIIMREILVTGLREFLGDFKLRVSWLAKWKTTTQMIAIAVLFATGIFAHMLIDRMTGMDQALIAEIFEGGDDPLGLRGLDQAARISWWGGVSLGLPL